MNRLALMLTMTVAFVAMETGSALADRLSGSWTGGGSVEYADTREKARCRANFTRVSGTLYRMSASCATPSGRVDQIATVNRVGDGEYAGDFRNTQYNVTGSIYLRLRGDSQYVKLTGAGGGSGTFKLHRN